MAVISGRNLKPKTARKQADIMIFTDPAQSVSGSRRRKVFQALTFSLFRVAAVINGLALFIIVYFMVTRGWRAITWTFLTQPPMDSMTKGGILPCIVGTFCLSIGAIIVAMPVGIASAVYLNEYARPGRALRLIRLGINNLAGVPSVVFGLFGLAFFVVILYAASYIIAHSLFKVVFGLLHNSNWISTESATWSISSKYRL